MGKKKGFGRHKWVNSTIYPAKEKQKMEAIMTGTDRLNLYNMSLKWSKDDRKTGKT